jgi:hypothetical protein
MSEQLYWLRDDNANWQKVPKNVYDAEMQIRHEESVKKAHYYGDPFIAAGAVAAVTLAATAVVVAPWAVGAVVGGAAAYKGLKKVGQSASDVGDTDDDDDELTYEKAPVQYSEEQKNSIFLSVAVVSVVLLFLIAFAIYTLSNNDIAGRPTFDLVEVVFLVGPLIGVIGFFGVYFAHKKLKSMRESKDYEISNGWGLRLLWFVSFVFISVASLVWILS